MFKRLLFLTALLLPGVAFAGSHSDVSYYSGPILILTFYSVVSAVTLGIITSVIVIINGRRMKGGVFGSALKYLGIGMFIVLMGTVVSFSPALVPQYLQGTLPSILNTIGYVIMAIAANNILKITKS